MRRFLICGFAAVLSAAASAQGGIMHGNGAPGSLTPPANCAFSRFYVDDSTQKLYIANAGSPCVWTDPSVPMNPAASSSTAVPVTSFTTETVICSLTVPANTLSATQDAVNSRIHYHASLTTSGGGGSDVLNAGLTNSSSGVPNHTVIAATATTAGRQYFVDLYCGVRGGGTGYCDGIITQTSTTVSGQANIASGFDPTAPLYLKVSATQTVGTDTVTCNESQWSVY